MLVTSSFEPAAKPEKKLWGVYRMKQTRSKLRAHVVHVYIEYVCFMYASSCKRGIIRYPCLEDAVRIKY